MMMMHRFPLLDATAPYRACEIDLLVDAGARRYWIDFFERHFEVQLEAAGRMGVSAESIAEARSTLHRLLFDVRANPSKHGSLDILVLDRLRQIALEAGGIEDEFRPLKDRENERSLRELPAWLETLRSLNDAARVEKIIHGMLAGNLFDMGAKATAERFTRDGSVAFDKAIASLPCRPWRYDDLDAFSEGLRFAPPSRVVMFADNAGADVVLGLLPLAGELLDHDAEVIIAANSKPNLNDITARELRVLQSAIEQIDSRIASDRLRVVENGSTAPLIDLSMVSRDLADAAAGADLIVLIGMGRAIESNWSASFTCACLRIAMIKDPRVAGTVKAELYDAICRFDPA